MVCEYTALPQEMIASTFHTCSIVMFTHFYLASASGDQEEDGHEKEEGASNTTSVPAASEGPPAPIKCSLGSKRCKDNAECVLYNHVCDGEADCGDGSDEEECSLACEIGNLVVGFCGCDLPYVGSKYLLPSSG